MNERSKLETTTKTRIEVDARSRLMQYLYGRPSIVRPANGDVSEDGCPKCCPGREDEIDPVVAWYNEQERIHGKFAQAMAERRTRRDAERAIELQTWQRQQQEQTYARDLPLPELLDLVEVIEPEQEQPGFWSRLLGNKPKQITASNDGAYVDTATLRDGHYFVVGSDNESTVKLWRK